MANLGKDAVGRFLGTFLFPRITARFRRWTTRTWSGVAFVVIGNTLGIFVTKQFVMPHVRRWGEYQDQQRAELAATLGREPTAEEVRDYFVEQARSSAAQ